MVELPPPAHTPCELCGASVPRGSEEAHVCEEERRLDYLVFQVRDELAAFDDDLASWLDSPDGREAQDDASRRRPPR